MAEDGADALPQIDGVAVATGAGEQAVPGAASSSGCRSDDDWCFSHDEPTRSVKSRLPPAPFEPGAVSVEPVRIARRPPPEWTPDAPSTLANFRDVVANDDGYVSYVSSAPAAAGLTPVANYSAQSSGPASLPGTSSGSIQIPAVSGAGGGAAVGWGRTVDAETLRLLATGRLGARAIGLFPFTLAERVLGTDILIIKTVGSAFDTEIAVFDARGRLVATNDDLASGDLSSQLRFGLDGDGGLGLAAGDYTLVLAGFNSIFGDGQIASGASPGGDFQVAIESARPVQVPSAPGYLAKDGNILSASIREFELGRGLLPPHSVKFFDFSLLDDILGGDWLVIHSAGSDFDTEIGLYDADGKLVATNDDVGPDNLLSRLSFGLDGDHGRSLPAGDYTLALGGFNSIFHDGLDVSSSLGREGEYSVYLQSSRGIQTAATRREEATVTGTVPEPSALYLAALGLAALCASRRFGQRG